MGHFGTTCGLRGPNVNSGSAFATLYNEERSDNRPHMKGAPMASLDEIREQAEAAIGQVAENIKPEDIAAGAQLAAEAVTNEAKKFSADIASIKPEDVSAAAELISETVTNAVKKAKGEE